MELKHVVDGNENTAEESKQAKEMQQIQIKRALFGYRRKDADEYIAHLNDQNTATIAIYEEKLEQNRENIRLLTHENARLKDQAAQAAEERKSLLEEKQTLTEVMAENETMRMQLKELEQVRTALYTAQREKELMEQNVQAEKEARSHLQLQAEELENLVYQLQQSRAESERSQTETLARLTADSNADKKRREAEVERMQRLIAKLTECLHHI